MSRPWLMMTLALGGCSAVTELAAPVDGGAGRADALPSVDALPMIEDATVEGDAASPAPDQGPDGGAGCVDQDDDGFGDGCAAGPDCDDDNPQRSPGLNERCSGVDEDCDGAVDEDWPSLDSICTAGAGACARPGQVVCAEDALGVLCDAQLPMPSAETCNGIDDDCDGVADERVARCCQPGEVRPCGEAIGACVLGQQSCTGEQVWGDCEGTGASEERCDTHDNDCDGRVDEGLTNACGACGAEPNELCNDRDDDCDGRTDEGVTNDCGACGATPDEQCNTLDDDCDGRTDEGVTNGCGTCGPGPVEACDGQDNDCDGRTDEGTTNACGACGPAPEERCGGGDEDCDGRVDEDVCRIFVRDDVAGAWQVRAVGSHAGPYALNQVVDAAFAYTDGLVWVFTETHAWTYDINTDLWGDSVPRGDIAGVPLVEINTAAYVPPWWVRRGTPDADWGVVQFLSTNQVHGINVNADGALVPVPPVASPPDWSPPLGPGPSNVVAGTLFTRGGAGLPGRPSAACAAGGDALESGYVFLERGGRTLWIYEGSACHRFLAPAPVAQWPAANQPGAPDWTRVGGWAHFNPEAGNGTHVIFLR
jgi:hypothetical protein